MVLPSILLPNLALRAQAADLAKVPTRTTCKLQLGGTSSVDNNFELTSGNCQHAPAAGERVAVNGAVFAPNVQRGRGRMNREPA
jgi:hypothetical protein